MKKFSANYIFPGNASPIKNGVVVLDNNGVILNLLDPAFDAINWNEVEQHEGIICPGFINTHCHLELSYLRGEMTEKTKLHGFVKEIIAIRNEFSTEFRANAMQFAEDEMIDNGIVAVGDISNGDSTFALKEKSKIKYHTFIEVFGSDPKIANEVFEHSKAIYDSYLNTKRASITPHATYSVSDNLVKNINLHAQQNNNLISIHNQETASENEFYQKGTGELLSFFRITDLCQPSVIILVNSFLRRSKGVSLNSP